jgi:hypothetical protein
MGGGIEMPQLNGSHEPEPGTKHDIEWNKVHGTRCTVLKKTQNPVNRAPHFSPWALDLKPFFYPVNRIPYTVYLSFNYAT